MIKNILTKLIILLSLSSAASAEQNRTDFDEYKWKKRLILLFTDSKDNEEFSKQIAELEKQVDKNEDREIKIITLVKDKHNQDYFNNYDIKSPFSLILLGKDGGVKLKKESFVEPKEIYGLIDSMPMRKLEMFEKEVL